MTTIELIKRLMTQPRNAQVCLDYDYGDQREMLVDVSLSYTVIPGEEIVLLSTSVPSPVDRLHEGAA